jgi:FkbM family methyltransferase
LRRAAPLRPQPQTAGTCPRCDTPLQVRAIRIPGWRALIDGECTSCEHRFLQDLPNGHAVVYPTTLDLTTGETFDPLDATWFSAPLRRGWEHPDGDPVELDTHGSAAGPVVLANCLDPIYGHAVLKLLGVQRELERADGADVITVVPASLVFMVPDGVAETWSVRGPVTRLFGWLLELEDRLGTEIQRFDECRLAALPPHPHPSTFDLDRFVGHIEPEPRGRPSVVLSLRPDRRWGIDAESESANVAQLTGALRAAYPDVAITAVGAARPGGLPPDVVDLRNTTPGEEEERRWIALGRGADLVVGVHGSNLVLPSGLAKATVELIPRERFGNYLQASLVVQTDPLLALDRHRVLYGDDQLSDVIGQRVAEVAIEVLDGGERVAALMTGHLAGVGDGPPRRLPAVPDRKPPPVQPTRQERALSVVRSVAARSRDAVRQRIRSHRSRTYDGPLPLVMHDARGIAFELLTAEEVEAFERHGGHFEARELAFLGGYVRAGMTAIDVGASVGAFTAVLARGVGQSGRVHAFEPLKASRERLNRTLELNGLHDVVVSDLAVSDTTGGALLSEYGPGFESWSTLAPRAVELEQGALVAQTKTEVQTTTLDAYCADQGIGHIDVLKVDVEGAELRVLDGAGDLLERRAIDLLMLEVADTTLQAAGDSAVALIDRLERSGLRTCVLGESGALVPFRVVGSQLELVNVIALSPSARRRLA